VALALGAAALYAIGGWNLLSDAVLADSRPAPETPMEVTIRIVRATESIDVYCIPKSGIAAETVEVSPGDALMEFRTLCADYAETPFHAR
jgi:hypothetical protein